MRSRARLSLRGTLVQDRGPARGARGPLRAGAWGLAPARAASPSSRTPCHTLGPRTRHAAPGGARRPCGTPRKVWSKTVYTLQHSAPLSLTPGPLILYVAPADSESDAAYIRVRAKAILEPLSSQAEAAARTARMQQYTHLVRPSRTTGHDDLLVRRPSGGRLELLEAPTKAVGVVATVGLALP